MSGVLLSTDATRLLTALRSAGATTRGAAVTDHCLAELTRLPERVIIDAARELLNHGVLVLAGCGRQPGRWIGTPREALAYRAALERRLRSLAGRISALDAALAAHRGQLELPLEAPR